MTVLGALPSLRKRGEMSPYKRLTIALPNFAVDERRIAWSLIERSRYVEGSPTFEVVAG